ncbi:Hypothetical predicted protein [Mytilus galloprovincialis]|uniref:Zinc finger PHD-type domain-containing protein n=1 Tax=Mytilus galloprovincialis TaxID=29158 RepID=A0A8B6EU04_MYTGA|nr:Hypothetical predicted protein [Mytilus galloprovincialis]
MSDKCYICENTFNYSIKRKRYNRVSIDSKLSRNDETVREVLTCFGCTPEKLSDNMLVCLDCAQLLSKHQSNKKKKGESLSELKLKTSGTYIGHKIEFLSSPETTSSKRIKVNTPRKMIAFSPRKMILNTQKQKKTLKGSKKLASSYLVSSRYNRLFSLLLKTSTAAKKAFYSQVKTIVRQEVSALVRPSSKSVWRSSSKHGIDSIMQFSWDKVLEETKLLCPVLYSSLSSAIAKQDDLTKRIGERHISLKPNLGCVIGQIVFAQKPTTMKFLQEITGVQLWLSGTAREAFVRLNHLGLTLSTDAVRSAVDRLRMTYDKELIAHKNRISTYINDQAGPKRRLFTDDEGDVIEDDVLDALLEEMDSDDDLDKTIPYEEEETQETEKVEDLDLNNNETDQADGDIVMDDGEPNNVEVHAYEHPIDSIQDDGHDCDDCNDACNEEKLGYSIVFDNVNKHIKARSTDRKHGNTMKNMVQAYAAVDRIPSLHLSDEKPTSDQISQIPIESYLPDDNFRKSLRKDFIVEVKKILKTHLEFFTNMYLSEDNDDHCYSRQSSKKSKLIPLGVLNKDECKIAEMIDVMEDYHKYVPMGTDMNPFIIPLYGDQLSVERANDAQNARINAESQWDQLQGLHPSIQEWHKRAIILVDTYKVLFSSKSARSVGTLSHIRNTYRHINVKADVQHSFNEATELLRFATTSYVLASALSFMKCQKYTDLPEDLPTDQAQLEIFFHDVACHVVDMCYKPPNTAPVINASTSNKESYKYCVCKVDNDEGMISCDNKKCNKGKWFHFSCIGISEQEAEDLEDNERMWFCCEGCRTSKKTITDSNNDSVFEYSCMLLYRGLKEIAHHNAIRKNNGLKLIDYWKNDLFQFYELHHTKYFLCAHQLITDVSGGVSERLGHQLVWNRTVNMKGENNSNIEMDLQMEFFNREFKESIKDAGGNITETTIARHSEMVGVSKYLARFMSQVCNSAPHHNRTRTCIKREDDMIHLVDQLLKNSMCKKGEPRQHCGFTNISNNNSTSHPVHMRKRIEKLLKKRVKRNNLLQ